MARIEFSLTDLADGTINVSMASLDDAGQVCQLPEYEDSTPAQKAASALLERIFQIARIRLVDRN